MANVLTIWPPRTSSATFKDQHTKIHKTRFDQNVLAFIQHPVPIGIFGQVTQFKHFVCENDGLQSAVVH